jgi:thiol-disulfide isomerase/thioredoxin
MLRLLPLALVALATVAPAHAADVRKFDVAAFNAAKAQNRPILVDVKAWWCPVCASQNRTIKRIVADPAYNQLIIFELNFDTQKAERQALSVNRQATLIGYRGQRQVGRLDFVTDKAKIGDLLAATVR